MTKPEDTKVYTLQEVADVLRVSRQTLYNNIRSGRLKAMKLGRTYRITEEQLQDILRNGYNGNK